MASSAGAPKTRSEWQAMRLKELEIIRKLTSQAVTGDQQVVKHAKEAGVSATKGGRNGEGMNDKQDEDSMVLSKLRNLRKKQKSGECSDQVVPNQGKLTNVVSKDRKGQHRDDATKTPAERVDNRGGKRIGGCSNNEISKRAKEAKLSKTTIQHAKKKRQGACDNKRPDLSSTKTDNALGKKVQKFGEPGTELCVDTVDVEDFQPSPKLRRSKRRTGKDQPKGGSDISMEINTDAKMDERGRGGKGVRANKGSKTTKESSRKTKSKGIGVKPSKQKKVKVDHSKTRSSPKNLSNLVQVLKPHQKEVVRSMGLESILAFKIDEFLGSLGSG